VQKGVGDGVRSVKLQWMEVQEMVVAHHTQVVRATTGRGQGQDGCSHQGQVGVAVDSNVDQPAAVGDNGAGGSTSRAVHDGIYEIYGTWRETETGSAQVLEGLGMPAMSTGANKDWVAFS